MKPLTLLCTSLLITWTDAASFPVMYCTNEAETSDQCSTEAILAVEATKEWFDAYSIKHADQKKDRRHLLDCSRFCNTSVTYFSIHYPCECTKNRRLASIETPSHMSRSLEYNPLLGPIQLFKAFASRLPESHCRAVLDNSRCIVTFVDKYDSVISDKPSNGNGNGEQSDPHSGNILDESYDPKTGKYEVYDPETGDVVQPNNDDEDYSNGDVAGGVDLEYDPKTGKYRKVDPVTGEYLDNDGETTDGQPTGSGNDVEFADEIYDPVTGQIHKVDPNTGEYIDEVKEYEEVYDPVTGKYHQIDPNTGEYVDEQTP